MFSGYFLGYFFWTIKILEKSKDLQIDHQASFLMPLLEIKVEEKLYFYNHLFSLLQLSNINWSNYFPNYEG